MENVENEKNGNKKISYTKHTNRFAIYIAPGLAKLCRKQKPHNI